MRANFHVLLTVIFYSRSRTEGGGTRREVSPLSGSEKDDHTPPPHTTAEASRVQDRPISCRIAFGTRPMQTGFEQWRRRHWATRPARAHPTWLACPPSTALLNPKASKKKETRTLSVAIFIHSSNLRLISSMLSLLTPSGTSAPGPPTTAESRRPALVAFRMSSPAADLGVEGLDVGSASDGRAFLRAWGWAVAGWLLEAAWDGSSCSETPSSEEDVSDESDRTGFRLPLN